MTVYQVRLFNPDLQFDRTIPVSADQSILDGAEAAGIRLPSGCLQGNCSACVAQLIAGEVDQQDQSFLQSEELAAGYTVTCVAYPRSDCQLLTHQESVLYPTSLYTRS